MTILRIFQVQTDYSTYPLLGGGLKCLDYPHLERGEMEIYLGQSNRSIQVKSRVIHMTTHLTTYIVFGACRREECCPPRRRQMQAVMRKQDTGILRPPIGVILPSFPFGRSGGFAVGGLRFHGWLSGGTDSQSWSRPIPRCTSAAERNHDR
jgi:hypothetical protein